MAPFHFPRCHWNSTASTTKARTAMTMSSRRNTRKKPGWELSFLVGVLVDELRRVISPKTAQYPDFYGIGNLYSSHIFECRLDKRDVWRLMHSHTAIVGRPVLSRVSGHPLSLTSQWVALSCLPLPPYLVYLSCFVVGELLLVVTKVI